jgi:hypothetical protein
VDLEGIKLVRDYYRTRTFPVMLIVLCSEIDTSSLYIILKYSPISLI